LFGGIYGLVGGYKAGGIGLSLVEAVVGVIGGYFVGAIFSALIGGLLPIILLGALLYAVFKVLGIK
jgi:uncharacterized membrane protein